MDILKIVNRVYIIYTIYIILSMSTTTLNLIDILPAVLIMWICYFMFMLGFKNSKQYAKIQIRDSTTNNWLIRQKKKKLFFIGMISLILSSLAVNFYTGQTPVSTLQTLINGQSLYLDYQNYFKVNRVGELSLTKIPYIGILIYLKFILIYSWVSLVLLKNKLYTYEKIYLLMITISSIYVGVARGTSFEFFELLILYFFVTFSKSDNNKMTLGTSKKFLFLFFLVCIMIFIFYSGISARGMEFNYKISRDIYYNPDGILPTISKLLSSVVILLFDYFGFGFFYISRFVSDIWFVSLENFIAVFIPKGISIISSQSIPDQMQFSIDMGARWHPDLGIMINSWGILGVLIFSFLMGMFSCYLKKQFELGIENILVYITYYFILLQMIALPVGNFVRVSSANKFLVTLLFIIWCWKLLKLPRICLVNKQNNL